MTLRKVIYWGTVAAGAVAAYMMWKRGESFGSIAKNTLLNPVGSLTNELSHARA